MTIYHSNSRTSDPITERSPDDTAFSHAVESVREGADPNAQAEHLYSMMTDQERLALLDGDIPFWIGMQSLVDDGYNAIAYPMGAIPRIGIPGLRFVDGPRGCVKGHGTAFPVPLARGATWDVDLEKRVGTAIGTEIRYQGGNFFGGICINLPRHPAWGRIQETYSDQSLLLGRMGAALATGVRPNAMTCVKHFACNSMENTRFTADVHIDEADYQETYLPHFKHVVDSGCDAVMTAYNSVNGECCGQNRYNLTDVLRDDWGFDGITVSDFNWGIRDAAASLEAGLDVEEPFSQVRAQHLSAQLSAGETSWNAVRRSAIRILATQLRFHARIGTCDLVSPACPEHIALAHEAAVRSLVLLKNEKVHGRNALPLPPRIRRIAVLGHLAKEGNMGDEGSSNVHPPYVCTPLQGLRETFPETHIVHDDGENADTAAVLASEADCAIVFVGYGAHDEGEFVSRFSERGDLLQLCPQPTPDEEQAIRERLLHGDGKTRSIIGSSAAGGDRHDLHLHESDIRLIRAVAAVNRRTIVVLIGAGPMLIEDWLDDVPAVLLGWYAGMEGGRAIADVLSGASNPSGHLPFSMVRSQADLPEFSCDSSEISYDRWYGQRLIQHRESTALFPLGFGLSYTDYRIIDCQISETMEPEVDVTVRNEGPIEGFDVIQLYGTTCAGKRAGERELIGFAAVNIPAHEEIHISIPIDFTQMSQWNPDLRQLVPPQGEIIIEASKFWGDPDSPSVRYLAS